MSDIGGLAGSGFNEQGSGNVSQQTGTGRSSSTSGSYIIPGMQDIYQNLLGANEGNYNQLLSQYGAGMQNVGNNSGGINAGYGDVLGGVEKTLGMGAKLGGDNWGVAQPAATAIGQAFARQQGTTSQQLASAGLGNSTITGNMQNQNALFAGQAYAGLGANLAQTAAGYQSQLGQAGLESRWRGLGMQNSLTQSYLGDLAGYRFANTAGNLTGQQSQSQSTNDSMGASHGGSVGTSAGPSRGGSPGGGLGQGQGGLGQPSYNYGQGDTPTTWNSGPGSNYDKWTRTFGDTFDDTTGGENDPSLGF